MIDPEWALAFAADWIESWNAHDMNRILSHYTDDFEMSSLGMLTSSTFMAASMASAPMIRCGM